MKFKKEPVHNPVLELLRDDILRDIAKSNPKIKDWYVFLTEKERKKFQDEIDDLEPYGA